MNFKNIRFGFVALCLAFASFANAQQLPNNDFSQAGGDFNGSTQPASWNGSNVTQVGLKFTFVEWKQGAGRNGDGAVSVSNKEVGALGITATAPGYLSLGQPFSYVQGLSKDNATAGTEGGIAFTYRPDTMSVWLQRSANGQEDLNLVVYSWKGTSKSNKYAANGGGCLTMDRDYIDEESDIRQDDKNTCGTNVEATQISDGHYRTRETWSEWREIKVPVKYYNDEIPEKINVILSSGNYPNFRANSGMYAGNSILVDEVKLIYSSKIHELRLNNVPYASFNPAQLEYTIEVAEGESMPTITAKRSGRTLSGSEISINYGAIEGAPTTVTVKAEDGSSTTAYTINFVRKRDTNPRLNSLSVNGTPISGFASNVSNYKVSLPYGITGFPEITYEKGHEGQQVEIKECPIPGTAQVVVHAENPEYSMTYNIEFSVGELTDTTLEDILVNGKSIPGYSPTKLTYTVEVPTGTTEDPEISYVSAYPEGMQTVVVVNNGLNGQSTITVSAPGTSTSRVYKLSFKVTESSYCYLDNIYLDGVPLDGFAPETFSYDVALGPDAVSLPEITFDKGDEYQNVTIESGGLDGTTLIKVSAQNGINSAVYRLNFNVQKSSNSKLSAIYIGGEPLENFSADVTTYKVLLPVGTVELPEITWEKGDEYQTVTPTYGGINGETKLLVTAQSGARTQYVLGFSVQKADVSTLEGISLGGIPLEGFSPLVTEYDIVLPVGTVVLPDIAYTVHDEYQVVTVDRGNVNGTTRITVRAQSGAVTIYYLNFSVQLSSNTRLSSIVIGGEPLADFEADKQDYSVELPAGTVELPTIEAVKADDYQTVSISKGGVNGVSVIYVQAQNGDSFEYRINFSVKKSENAYLAAIYVDGTLLDGFEAGVFNYDYTLDTEADECPEITVEKADANQGVQIVTPVLEGRATITVTPEQGDANIYTIDFAFERSADDKLGGITVGGEPLPGFSPDENEYDYVLPSGTVSLPAIEVQKGDDGQTVEVITNGVEGLTSITVVAANGSENVYNIDFSVMKSSVSTLKAVMIGDYEIEIVDGVYEYEYILPEPVSHAVFSLRSARADNAVLPLVVPIKSDALSNLTMCLPKTEGLIIIKTYSEDGSSNNVYTINVHYAEETSAELKSLTVGGEAIELRQGVYEYDIERPYGFETQEVSYEKAYAGQIVSVSNNRNVISVEVVAESGDKAVYTINVNELPATNATLKGLEIYDAANLQYVPLDGFAADKYDYEYLLAQGTETVPAVNPVLSDDMQKIQIVYGKPGSATVIKVTAGNGDTSEYKIVFKTEKSSVSSLGMIYLDGEELGNFNCSFDPAIFEYRAILPYGTTDVPAITYDMAHEGEKVNVAYGGLNEAAFITVVAEDGSQSVYTLYFDVDYNGKSNTLANIMLDGDGIENFSPDTYEYTVVLPYNSTTPSVAYTKSFNEQSVLVANEGLNRVKLTVRSNIGLEDAEYVINFTIAENPASLSAITINGSDLAGFDTRKYKYVYTVPAGEDTPQVKFFALDGSEIAAAVSNVNYAQCVNTVGEESLTYTVYFHYADDVIPNGDFSEWTGTVYNNAQKPTGWTAPADVAEKYKFTATYYTGNEVVNDGGLLMLQTYYKSNASLFGENNNYSISGAIPGMITTGDMSVNLASAGNSTSSVSGGITFRNTPDQVSVDYNPISNERITNWRMLVNYYDANGTQKENLYEGSYDTKNQWQTANLKLLYSATERLVGINKFNFVLNASHSEMGLGSATAANPMRSVLYVDNLRAVYNSAITSVKVNGVEAVLDGDVYTVQISDTGYYRLPEIEIDGEVPDQEYVIDYGTEVAENNTVVRNVKITSYAEDGTSSEYALRITRPIYNYLSDIKINGTSLEGFAPDKFEYKVSLPAGSSAPDIQAFAATNSQDLEYYVEGDWYSVSVTNINGGKMIYNIIFEAAASTDNKLAGIFLDGESLEGFAPDKLQYAISLPAGTKQFPVVSVKKGNAGQYVEINETEQGASISVYAESDADKANANVYEIAMSVLPADNTTKQLKSLEVYGLQSGESQIDFAADTYNYEFARVYGRKYGTVYAPLYAEDVLTVDITDKQVTYTLSNDNSAAVAGDVRYVLAFADEEPDDSRLGDILADGVSLPDFNAGKYEYQVDVTDGSYPKIEAVKAYDYQTVAMTYDAGSVAYIINVSAPGAAEASVYTVRYNAILSQDATLATLVVAGEEIVLQAGKYAYEYQLPEGTTRLPDVTANANDDGAQVGINLPQSVEGSIEIVVTSEDGNFTQTYTVQLSVKKSDNAKLQMIYAGHKEIDGFDPGQSGYQVTVKSGESKPVISWQKAQVSQSVEVTDSETQTVLTVTAEDGLSTFEYVIAYVYEYSSEAGISSISVDGKLLDGFEPSRYDYALELPVGTAVLPEISIKPLSDKQSTEIDNGGVNGDYVITAVSEDGSNTVVYTIHFSVKPSEYDNLSMIYIGGEKLSASAAGFETGTDFAPDVYEYDIILPVGSSTVPMITADKGDAWQHEPLIESSADAFTVKITATAQAGNQKVYTLNFSVKKSDVATLKMIYVNYEAMNTESANFEVDKDFAPDVFEYGLELPVGSNPEDFVLTFDKGDSYQNAVANREPDVYKVDVAAEDGIHTNTYTVNISVKKSDNAYLSDLLVNGITVDGFAPGTLSYSIDLPVGTVTMPNVTYVPGDAYQRLVHQVSEDGGYHKIIVTSQSGKVNEYEIIFNVLKSDNAELEDLRISHADADLQLSPAFDPQVYDYVLTLPYEYRDELPKFIAIEKSGQTIESEHQPESADDSYSVTVLAENGTSTKTYTVKLMLMPSDIVTLDMIYADGAEIDGFDPQVAYYEIELPYGTENCPIVSWDLTEPGSETAEAAYSETSDGWSVSITVTAASGDVNEYVLHFIIGKDAENRLASFKVSGKTVEGFDPDETQYTVTYPAYTDSSVLPVVDDITYELMHPGTSTATVIQSDANTIVIQVTAANGEVRNYVLETVIEISDNTGLEALYVDGELVDGFVPEIDEYYYSLPFGSTFVDETIVTYQAAESGQTVTLYKDGMDVKVSVTAQDGSSMRVYTIHFVSSSFDPSKQATLEDVCVTSTADGYWKFTTKCNNVYVCLADLSGRPIANVMLPLVDPNVPDICSPSAEGYLYVPQSSEVLIYFFHSNGYRITSGKIRTHN